MGSLNHFRILSCGGNEANAFKFLTSEDIDWVPSGDRQDALPSKTLLEWLGMVVHNLI